MKYLSSSFILLLFALAVNAQNPSNSPDKKETTKTTVKTESAEALQGVLAAIDKNMVMVEAGGFSMGCTGKEDTGCYYWEQPAHKVMISKFYISKFDVTQKEWQAVMGTKPWYSKDCENCPVENISWYDAQMFISKLNQLTGKGYRLPTEAEWEYVAGGGTHGHGYKYAGSNDANAVAWFDSNSGGQPKRVGLKQPNELGIYDLSGNVWQWCSDWFGEKYYTNSPADNPVGPKTGTYRALRGGSWWGPVKDCRVTNRDRYPADAKDNDVGFRLARD